MDRVREHAQDANDAGPGAAARGDEALEAPDVHPHMRLFCFVESKTRSVGSRGVCRLDADGSPITCLPTYLDVGRSQDQLEEGAIQAPDGDAGEGQFEAPVGNVEVGQVGLGWYSGQSEVGW